MSNFTAKESFAFHVLPLPAAKGICVAILFVYMSSTASRFRAMIKQEILFFPWLNLFSFFLGQLAGFDHHLGGLLELPGFALGPELAGAANDWILCRADGRKDKEGQEKNDGRKLHFEAWFLFCHSFLF
jgi:hypothetical protein